MPIYLISFSQTYQVGTFVKDTLQSGNYTSLELCFPYPDFSLIVDPALLPFATGVDLYIEITAVNAAPSSIYTSQTGALEVGDSLSVSPDTSTYDFYFWNGGSVEFNLIAEGIPETPGEEFTCQVSASMTLAICGNWYTLDANPLAGLCTVDSVITGV
jgi:hypothetical protein